MLLSQLDILGFKSFARRTRLTFSKGITGIVGPNGCGKSNIVDSIRWVMGEQKGSVLRSEKMEQVIFAGTQNQKALGLAQVDITLLNDNGLLPSEYTEIVVSRRLYRSGESEYLLNKKKCRLKDITDLFLDTGLGADSYGIIEPGLINRILTDNPEERRLLFEEAAGVAKYKLRVKTAERRLEMVNDNLDRITDILSEVEKNVRRLKKQYNQARAYETLRKRSEELETVIMAVDRAGFVKELDIVRARAGEMTAELERIVSSRTVLENDLDEITLIYNRSEESSRSTRANWEKFSSETLKAENSLLIIDEKERSSVSEKERSAESCERSQQQIYYLDERIANLQTNISELEFTVSEARSEYSQIESEWNQAESAASAAQKETEHLERKADDLRKTASSAEKEASARIYKIGSFDERRKALTEESGNLKKRSADIETRRKVSAENKSKLEHALNETDSAVAGLEEQIKSLHRQSNGLEGKKSDLKIALERAKSELRFLKSLLESGGGMPEGAANVLKSKPAGIIESVGNLIGVKPEFAPAVETALGEAANYIVAESASAGIAAIDYLRRNSKGAVTVMPADADFPLPMEREIPPLGVIGTADSLTECDSRFRPMIRYLLGNVLVAQDWDSAVKIRRNSEWNGLIVTLAGEAVGKYTLSGGKSEAKYPVVGRKKRFDETSLSIAEIEKGISASENEISVLKITLSDTENKLKTLRLRRNEISGQLSRSLGETTALEAEQKSASARIDAIEKDFSRLESEKTTAENELFLYSEKLQGLNIELTDNQNALAEKRLSLRELRAQSDGIKDELHRIQLKVNSRSGELEKLKSEANLANSRRKELKDEISRLQNRMTEIDLRLQTMSSDRENIARNAAESEKQRNFWKQELEKIELEQNEIRRRRVLIDRDLKEKYADEERLKREITAMEISSAELKSRISAKEDNCAEKYGVDLSAVEIPPECDREEMDKEIASVRKKLSAIGSVNLLAIEEYGVQKERLDFLQSEHLDIIHSKEELMETISKTNNEARSRFKNVFEQVQENFRLLFADLFEGGSGEISLGSGDILDSVIELKANPSGKKLSSLDQLSGGEKTLTALALIFSLYQIKPSPFCILDEADAPLDDANVERFIKLIKRFTPQTQFILITHNKITMEACDFLYGVTMEEEGMSKLVSVDLNTTHKTAESL